MTRPLPRLPRTRAKNLSKDHEEAEAPYFRTYSGVWASGLLAVFYAGTGPFSQNIRLLEQKGAVAEKILDGQVWRAVTRHVPARRPASPHGEHGLFSHFFHRRVPDHGYGVGWLLILLAGALGNLASAWLYQSHHLSGGASTAVFAALGILGESGPFGKRRLGPDVQKVDRPGCGLGPAGLLRQRPQGGPVGSLFRLALRRGHRTAVRPCQVRARAAKPAASLFHPGAGHTFVGLGFPGSINAFNAWPLMRPPPIAFCQVNIYRLY